MLKHQLARKQRIIALGICLSALLLALIGNHQWNNSHVQAASASHMPIGISPGYGFEDPFTRKMSASQQQAVIEQMKSDGVQWLRLDYWSNDTFDYQFIKDAEAAGIQVDALLEHFDATPQTFASLATQAVRTLEPLGVHTYEILNEVNIYTPTITAVRYTAILKAVYPAIKAADASATVLMSGLAMSGEPDAYLQAMYDAGAQGYFDAANAHPYSFYPAMPASSTCSNSNAFCSGLPALYNIMQKNGDGNKKIWITEFGCPTGTDAGQPAACTDALVAQQIIQAYHQANAWGWIGSFFVFSWQDNLTDGDFGLYRADGSAKSAALAAFKQVATSSTTATVAASSSSTTPIATSSPTPTATQVSTQVLSLSERGTSAKKPVSIKFTLQTSASMTVADLIVAIRDKNNNNLDLGVSTSIALTGTQSFSASKTLPAGTYICWVAYYSNGAWTSLNPVKTFQINKH